MEKLLVFIPAYNCEKQVTRVLSQLLDQRIAPWVGECIVVNNRSADGTEAAVQDWMARHPDAPVRLLRKTRNPPAQSTRAAATRSRSATRRPTGTSIWSCCTATTRALLRTCCRF